MKKVLLGMSGGVDSSVAALILKNKGYEVIGATMKLCNNEIEDAKAICEKLNIKHIVIDATKDFKEHVINDFICEYENCRTPNPCIECNKYLKFGVFYNKAIELGCDYIATGHYAKIEFDNKYNQYVIKKSKSENKDQTYFLYQIDKNVLDKVLFPLEDFSNKDDIRKIAEENRLIVAHKKDSQEICFIPDDDYVEFIRKEQRNINNFKKGNIVLKNGEILGKHDGLINYTIGQRKGLGISYKEPLYVIELDKSKNEVIVGTEEQLYKNELLINNCNFLVDIDLNEDIEVMAKVRFRSKESKAILIYNKDNNTAKVIFDDKQRAITPGQSVVCYIDDTLIGGGKIL